ncbi:MAG: hypothetical protein WC959_10420 [Kiritimatiellales bacterium]
MAYAVIHFKHPEIGTTRRAPAGFSWTMIFWGPFVCLFRKDFAGMLVITLLFLMFLTATNTVAAFCYNRMYIRRLMKKGYKVASVDGATFDSVKQRLELNLQEI